MFPPDFLDKGLSLWKRQLFSNQSFSLDAEALSLDAEALKQGPDSGKAQHPDHDPSDNSWFGNGQEPDAY